MKVFRVHAVKNENNEKYSYTVEANTYNKACIEAINKKKDKKDIINSVLELK